MRVYDILDKNLTFDANTLLEASAGTGKTFTIEHLVARLLIAGVPLPRLLAVTFTRAATRDLKMRIRQNIESALSDMRKGDSSFDYLHICRESERKLENALACFDEAQVYTIHGFCLTMLKEHGFLANVRVDLPDTESSLTKSEVLSFIKDFFRTEFNEKRYALSEMQLLLKDSVESLQTTLLDLLMSGKEIERPLSYREAFARLKKPAGFTTEQLFEQIPNYRGFCDRSKKVKPDLHKKLIEYGAFFEKEAWNEADFDWLIANQLDLLDMFSDPKADAPRWEFLTYLKKEIYPLICKNVVLARVAADCRQFFMRYLQQTEKFRFDDLLTMMKSALQYPAFKAKVRSRFSYAIIDEFQDTDPVQWEIFRDLFYTPDHRLFLVGDPKQSIYAFRQADIYTYLQAADDLGQSSVASLTTNYRSDPSLIRALNTLFSRPNFLPLPKRQTHLPYRAISSAPKAEDFPFQDGKGSIHFAVYKGRYSLEQMEQVFFPFIASEIKQLQRQNIAILVADRYQAERMCAYLQKWHIPFVNQRQKSLLDSPAYLCIKELIQAVLNPKDLSAIKIALGGTLFGWTHERIGALQGEELMEVMRVFYQQHEIVMGHGFGPFFKKLLSSSFFGSGQSVAEQIVSREGGEVFYHDLFQLAELLIESGALPEVLPQTLDRLELKRVDEDPSVQKRFIPEENGVKVLTIHSSKGLEFDIVFTLGLIKRVKTSEAFIPVTKEGKTFLTPVVDEESESFLNYCEEINAEKMRQLYVAFTRAKHRVYVPVVNHIQEDLRNVSPIDLFMRYLHPTTLQELCGNEISCSELPSDLSPDPHTLEEEMPSLSPPKPIPYITPPIKITSFSSLAKKSEEFQSTAITPETLPLGAESGNLLHLLLEKIPISPQWTLTDFEKYTAPFIEKTSYEKWGPELSRLLYNALNTPIFDQTPLKDIDPAKMYREMEFLFPEASYHIKGVIDLVFEHNGLYYLLDWKSNWLQDYHLESLQKCMESHDYFLQSKIYIKAFEKYLKLVDERPFEQIFGGMHYVFLRGLTNESGVLTIYGN